MMNWITRLILAWCVVLSFNLITADPNSCIDYVTRNEPQRSVDYTTGPLENNLCDYYNLDENIWYRFDSYTGSKIHSECPDVNKCGTAFPLWLNGAHPTIPLQPQNMQVCMHHNSPDNCCGLWSDTIQAMLCPAIGTDPEFYVYKLKRPTGCDAAYCVGTGMPCPPDNVWNDVAYACAIASPIMILPTFAGPFTEVLIDGTGSQYTSFYFICDIGYSQPIDDGARFDVALTYDGIESGDQTRGHRTNVSLTMSVRFEPIDFEFNIGKLVSCKVRSYWSNSNPHSYKSDYLPAPTNYWVGVRYRTEFDSNYNDVEHRVEFDESVSSVRIYFKSTIPISCGADCDVGFDVSNVAGMQSGCQFKFESETPDLEPYLDVSAKKTAGVGSQSSFITFLEQPPSFDVLSIWESYQLDPIHIYVTDYEPVSSCSSTGDPHITGLDGRLVHSYLPGDFLLFSSTSPRVIQIHNRQQVVLAGSNAVNCAVAVREGNNVYGVFACGKVAAATPIKYLEDPNVPASFTSDITGTKFTISMPSGTYVNINLFNWPSAVTSYYMNIYVYPTSEDKNTSSGYCGNYNGNPADDDIPDGVYSQQYLLKPEESLINGHIYNLSCVNNSAPVPHICDCKLQDNPCNVSSTVMAFITQSTYNCYNSWPNLRRRDDIWYVEDDNFIGPNDLPPVQDIGIVDTNRTYSWPTPSGITEQQARQACLRPIATGSTFSLCNTYVDVSNIIESCVEDILLLDTLDPADAVIDQFNENCLFQVKASENSSSTEGPSSPNYIESIHDNITNKICPNMCSGHGTCVDGTCVCDVDFVSVDCSIDENIPPTLTGFRKGPLCDARFQLCNSTYIYASGFYDSSGLIYKVMLQEIPGNPFYRVPIMISNAELQCQLPPSPATGDGGLPVTKWDISLSNDGNLFSNSLAMTVYDSLCVSCTDDGNCQQKTTACLIGGKCYAEHATSPDETDDPCMACVPSQNTTDWRYDETVSGCASATTISPTTTTECTTGETCMENCNGVPDGFYQRCTSCTWYLKCYVGIPYITRCDGLTVWDDNVKACQATSTTCIACT